MGSYSLSLLLPTLGDKCLVFLGFLLFFASSYVSVPQETPQLQVLHCVQLRCSANKHSTVARLTPVSETCSAGLRSEVPIHRSASSGGVAGIFDWALLRSGRRFCSTMSLHPRLHCSQSSGTQNLRLSPGTRHRRHDRMGTEKAKRPAIVMSS